MPRKKSIIAAATMAEMLRRAGAERVSDDAAREFAELATDIATEIAKDAIQLARHAGRKTVKKSDIELAKKRIKIF